MYNFIIDYIKAHQSKVTEYQLMTYLNNQRPEFFERCVGSSSLYKKHFKLYNLLYKIDEDLVKVGKKLKISALEIALLDSRTSNNTIGELDELRQFYLDTSNFELSDSEINHMLTSFWSKYAARQDISEYLAVLELEPNANPDLATIKRQFNKLAFERHPDQGGCAISFSKLNSAYRHLKLLFK